MNQGIFTENEHYADMNTADLKYLLVPFLLGELCGKVYDEKRIEHIKASNAWFFYL